MRHVRVGRAAIIVLALALHLFAWPFVAKAQQHARTVRIGWVGVGCPSARTSVFLEAFRQGMRDLGYVEGRNLEIEARWADGGLDRVTDLTADLVRWKADVMVTQAPVVSVVKRTAGTTPIFFGFSGDPVEAGLVSSLPHPGGTLTGMTLGCGLEPRRQEQYPGRAA